MRTVKAVKATTMHFDPDLLERFDEVARNEHKTRTKLMHEAMVVFLDAKSLIVEDEKPSKKKKKKNRSKK